MLYSYRYRLKPNNNQKVLLAKHFGSTRYIYNHFLAHRKEKYLQSKKSSTYFQDCKELTELKKTLPWIKEINSQSLQYALKRLDSAYNNFFAGRGQFPKFKNKYDKQSFRIPQNARIEDKLYIPKFLEGIRLIKHRELQGTIKFATISKNKSGQYFVSITVEKDVVKLGKTDKEVGIDLGIKTLATCSDGTIYENIKSYRTLKRKMKKLQRKHAKKVKGSKNREKARLKLAKIHQKIKNRRIDHIHKMTSEIINKNQVIYLETLAVQNMMKNHKLAGAIADCSWAEINRQLEYKANWYGREIIRISRWFPSSKTHEGCGYINQNLKLKDRNWVCQCGEIVDRDLNAAKMILKQGKIQEKLPLERRDIKRMDSEETLIELSIS